MDIMDRVITEVLHIMVIFVQWFREILDLDEMIMRFRCTAFPYSRRKMAPVTWVRQSLRRREDRDQYNNLITELYQEDQPTFINFMQMFPGIFTEIEHQLTPDIQRQSTFMWELLSPGLKLVLH